MLGKKKKKRYKIRQLNTTGKNLPAESEEVFKFEVKFQKVIKENNLSEGELFNSDEMGLNIFMQPSNTLAIKGEGLASGYRKIEERIIF